MPALSRIWTNHEKPVPRYDDIDYRREPDPPLDPADATWADELLRKAGKR
jgi:hypothetical protein